MLTTKEQKIQEAIRLVQECNYSRRKAASSTGISPNTLKRRLNGSIPREEYLERTKKITASEELILEYMIIALIQQGEHIKASALRSMVALYIQNKTAPTKLDRTSNNSKSIETIPKGWCTRFMKRSKNLTVNQGFIEIKDKRQAPIQEPLPPAFAVFMKPAQRMETLAETQQEIVNNASMLIEGFRKDFEYSAATCQHLINQGSAHHQELMASVDQLNTIFNDVTTLANVLNLTSHVTQQTSFSSNLLGNGSAASAAPARVTSLSPGPRTANNGSTTGYPVDSPVPQIRLAEQPSSKDETPDFYNSATPMTPSSPMTPMSPNSSQGGPAYQPSAATVAGNPKNKRRISVVDTMHAPKRGSAPQQQQQLPAKSGLQPAAKKAKTHSGRSISWSGVAGVPGVSSEYDMYTPVTTAPSTAPRTPPQSQLPFQWAGGPAPGTTTPFTAMIQATLKGEPVPTDYFSQPGTTLSSNEPVNALSGGFDLMLHPQQQQQHATQQQHQDAVTQAETTAAVMAAAAAAAAAAGTFGPVDMVPSVASSSSASRLASDDVYGYSNGAGDYGMVVGTTFDSVSSAGGPGGMQMMSTAGVVRMPDYGPMTGFWDLRELV